MRVKIGVVCVCYRSMHGGRVREKERGGGEGYRMDGVHIIQTESRFCGSDTCTIMISIMMDFTHTRMALAKLLSSNFCL